MPHRVSADNLSDLVRGVLAGKNRAIARAITLVESASPLRDELLEQLRECAEPASHRADGGSRVIGITGPPGAGKSTLIGELVAVARMAGEKVAVLAVDPSSPFSGGALLGDRLRMDRHGLDPGVYIRSMASRGRTGGLSPSALETVSVLTAAGFGTIIVESVGVGQSEVGILTLADLVLVVLNPGAGDEIQALKAGVMEIGDIYVVNKADYPEAESMVRTLHAAVRESIHAVIEPRVLRTIATAGTGVEALHREIGERLEALNERGELESRRRRRITTALQEIAGDLFSEWVRAWIERHGLTDPQGGVPFGKLRRELAAALETITVREGCMDEEDAK
ncbi:MAG: methylmalonyl Co-A mutase-associated GTPase MeaB [Spirochaetaceae bacterium]|nr:MAG: methylmalonyl Co-A mutase-associated GTPase MeaB [Spirochaetaceae bacterium]